jgi:hypothetical protein
LESQPVLLYNPITKVLMTDSAQVKVLKASRKARKGQFSSMGHQPRLSISVENFVNLMGRGYSVTDLKNLDVWASDDFLPVGIFQTEKSSAKRKQQRTIASSSQNTSNNMDAMGSQEIMPIADMDFIDTGLKRKSDLATRASAKRICRNSRTDKPRASKAPPTPPGTIDLTAGPSSGDSKFLNPGDLMEPGSSVDTERVSLDYTDLANEGSSVSERGFLDTVDLTDLSPDVREYTSTAYIDLTESAAEERVSLHPIDLAAQGKPVRQREHRFLGFLDLTGGEE